MDRSFSLYLEIARVFATLMVFGGHGFIFYQPLAEFNDIPKLGRDGVIIFFVLSGFVITWCANERDRSVVDFAINRASRIYSVAIPGIILGFVASIFLTLYTNQSDPYPLSKPWIYIPIYLTFIGNFWHLSETPPCNFPYWSLNYEVWYYVIFAAFFYIRSVFRWPIIVCLLALVGPNLIQLFPLWIMGSFLYYARKSIHLTEKLARLGIIITCILFVLLKAYGIDNSIDEYNSVIWERFFSSSDTPPQLLGDYLLGFIVVINFGFALSANIHFKEKSERIIKFCASFSFSFYLFHIPIFSVIKAAIPYDQSFVLYILILATTSIIAACIAKITEHKKGLYRSFFRQLLITCLRVKRQG